MSRAPCTAEAVRSYALHGLKETGAETDPRIAQELAISESTEKDGHANCALSHMWAGELPTSAGAVGEESDEDDAAGSSNMPATSPGTDAPVPEFWRNSRLEIATQFPMRTARLAKEMWTSRASR